MDTAYLVEAFPEDLDPCSREEPLLSAATGTPLPEWLSVSSECTPQREGTMIHPSPHLSTYRVPGLSRNSESMDGQLKEWVNEKMNVAHTDMIYDRNLESCCWAVSCRGILQTASCRPAVLSAGKCRFPRDIWQFLQVFLVNTRRDWRGGYCTCDDAKYPTTHRIAAFPTHTHTECQQHWC